MSGELTGDLISKWINFKLYPDSLEEPFFSPGVILACIPSAHHSIGADPVKDFLKAFFNRGSHEAEIEMISSKMDIQENSLIENSTISVIPKQATLEWLLPKEVAHLDVTGKKITFDLSMTLQFSDETLVKIKLEWDPTEIDPQILPEGASMPIPEEIHEVQENVYKAPKEIREDVKVQEEVHEEPLTSDVPDSIIGTATFPENNPAPKEEVVESEKEASFENNLHFSPDEHLSEPDEDKEGHIDLNHAPDEKNVGTFHVVNSGPSEHSDGDNEEAATLIESESHATKSNSITPTIKTPPKSIKNQSVPKATPKPQKKFAQTTTASEPNLTKVVSSPQRKIVKRSSSQIMPKTTSSLSRQSSLSSLPTHSPNRPSSQASSYSAKGTSIKGTRQTSLNSSMSSSNSIRRCDPNRLKSQIDFSSGSASNNEPSNNGASRPMVKSSSLSNVAPRPMPTRKELSTRHLATNFSIGNEDSSQPSSLKSSAPGWAKELRPYLNKGTTGIRL